MRFRCEQKQNKNFPDQIRRFDSVTLTTKRTCKNTRARDKRERERENDEHGEFIFYDVHKCVS